MGMRKKDKPYYSKLKQASGLTQKGIMIDMYRGPVLVGDDRPPRKGLVLREA